MSFKCLVTGLITLSGAGPTASTVYVPDLTCVLPASHTVYVGIPAFSALSRTLSLF